MASTQQLIQAGFADLGRGNWEAALQSALAALRTAPDDPGALTLAGRASLMGYSVRPALEIFEALARRHQIPETWLDLARAHVFARREDAALQAANYAVKLDPSLVQAQLVVGEIALSLGELETASSAFRAAIRAAPLEVKAYRGLARSADLSTSDPDVERMQNLLARDLDAASRAEIHYALSYVFRAAGEDDRFVQHMWAANAAQRETNSAGKQALAAKLAELDQALSRIDFARIRPVECTHPTPIFIVGMPRSGTTLVEQVLAGNANVAAGGEIDFVQGHLSRCYAQSAGKNFPEGFDGAASAEIERLMAPYCDLLCLIGGGHTHVTDKTPGNYHALGLLFSTLQNARAVGMDRNAMDTCFSILQQPFDARSPHTFDVELLAVAYAHHKRMMQQWTEKFPDRFLRVSYERFVESPRETGPEVARHFGLSWSDDMLSLQDRRSAVRTFSTRQVRSGVNARSVNAWRKFERELRPLIDALESEGVDF